MLWEAPEARAASPFAASLVEGLLPLAIRALLASLVLAGHRALVNPTFFGRKMWDYVHFSVEKCGITASGHFV